MLLTMIYMLNEKQEKFHSKLYRKLVEQQYENIRLVGDFNAITNLGKDFPLKFIYLFIYYLDLYATPSPRTRGGSQLKPIHNNKLI
uniref:Uncharacterized protein n=1 Tax=Naja naja TaxID=35670 RepID=A0A8C6V7R4_NAJNA